MRKQKADWSSNENHLVLCADIMGFKQMVEDPANHQNTEKTLRSFLDELKKAMSPLRTNQHIRLSLFSDSIFLATDCDSLQCLNLIIQASAIIMQICKKFKLPINGCIARGALTFDDISEVARKEGDRKEMIPMTLCFGYAISEAYLIQNAIHLYGIVFHPNMDGMLTSKSVANQKFPIYKLPIPLRAGGYAHLFYLSHCHVKTPKNSDGNCLDGYMDNLKEMELQCGIRARTYIFNTMNICHTVSELLKDNI